jgi:hypothetical protein
MPAPTPIDIRYGDPTSLGMLAGAAGTAGFNMDRFLLAHQDWQNRAAMDNQFLTGEANRRVEDTWRQNDLAYRYSELGQKQAASDRAFGLQEAVANDRSSRGWGNIRSDEQIAEENRKAQEQRLRETLEARRNGSPGSGGRSVEDLRLVPATGDIPTTPERVSTITPSGDADAPSVERYKGQTIQYTDDASRDLMRQKADQEAAARPEMVTRSVRSQLDYIDTLDLPEDKKNSLRVSVRNGGLKMDQLVDNARQAFKDPKVQRDLATRQAEQMTLEKQKIDALLASPNFTTKELAGAARQMLHITDPLDPASRDTTAGYLAVLQRLRVKRNLLESNISAVKPVVNSNGRSLTGGNVTTINSQAEYDALPSGAKYIDAMNGQSEQKP